MAPVCFVTALTPAPETRTLAPATGWKLALRTVSATVLYLSCTG